MLFSDRELSDAEIEELSEPKRGSKTYQIPGTNKSKRYDPEIRTVANWFKLPHTVVDSEGNKRECQVPSHDSERVDEKGIKQTRDAPRLFFVHESGLVTCRWCFVEGRDLND